MTRLSRSLARLGLLGLLGAMGCEPSARPLELRAQSESYKFRITSDPMPPRARERVLYKVVVRDMETNQPIEGGEGRIFASSRDGASTWDSFTQGPEVGTYYANLHYITAGDWAVGIQFRRDSTHRLERATDWMQEVRGARETTIP